MHLRTGKAPKMREEEKVAFFLPSHWEKERRPKGGRMGGYAARGLALSLRSIHIEWRAARGEVPHLSLFFAAPAIGSTQRTI